MGQPTSGVTQRVGHSQLWQYTPVLSYAERGFAESQFRLALSTRLVILFFQSLLYCPTLTWWVRSYRDRAGMTRVLAREQYRWEAAPHAFPAYTEGAVWGRYFEQGASRFLLQDGERAFYSLPYLHRRLRYVSIFWAQPRLVRVGCELILMLRGYNVTEPDIRPPRFRLPWLQRWWPWLAPYPGAVVAAQRLWF